MAQIGTLQIPDIFPDGVIARQVIGNDLIGNGIEDGDFLIIDPCRELDDGDIAVVIFLTPKNVRAEIVRHVRRSGNMLVLESSNPIRPAGSPHPERQPGDQRRSRGPGAAPERPRRPSAEADVTQTRVGKQCMRSR